MRVSGTPERPKPPARRVELGLRSEMAEEAEGKTSGGGLVGVVEEGRGRGAFVDFMAVES